VRSHLFSIKREISRRKESTSSTGERRGYDERCTQFATSLNRQIAAHSSDINLHGYRMIITGLLFGTCTNSTFARPVSLNRITRTSAFITFGPSRQIHPGSLIHRNFSLTHLNPHITSRSTTSKRFDSTSIMSAPKRHVPGSQPPASKSASTSTSSSKNRVIIQLHLNDLRTHDSPVLAHAHSDESSGITHFLPVYVWDERLFALSAIPGYDKSDQKPSSRPRTHRGLGDAPRNTSSQSIVPNPKTRLGEFWKTGRHRTKFTVESVFDLRESYRSKGGDLIVGCGHMEKFVESIVKGLQGKEGGGFEVPEVWMQKEVSLIVRSRCMIQRLRSGLSTNFLTTVFAIPGLDGRSQLPTTTSRATRTPRLVIALGGLETDD
jgi:hypothetical protein